MLKPAGCSGCLSIQNSFEIFLFIYCFFSKCTAKSYCYGKSLFLN